MNLDPDRQALMEQMTERFRRKLEQAMPDDNATLDQIEEAVEEIGSASIAFPPPDTPFRLSRHGPRHRPHRRTAEPDSGNG